MSQNNRQSPTSQEQSRKPTSKETNFVADKRKAKAVQSINFPMYSQHSDGSMSDRSSKNRPHSVNFLPQKPVIFPNQNSLYDQQSNKKFTNYSQKRRRETVQANRVDTRTVNSNFGVNKRPKNIFDSSTVYRYPTDIQREMSPSFSHNSAKTRAVVSSHNQIFQGINPSSSLKKLFNVQLRENHSVYDEAKMSQTPLYHGFTSPNIAFNQKVYINGPQTTLVNQNPIIYQNSPQSQLKGSSSYNQVERDPFSSSFGKFYPFAQHQGTSNQLNFSPTPLNQHYQLQGYNHVPLKFGVSASSGKQFGLGGGFPSPNNIQQQLFGAPEYAFQSNSERPESFSNPESDMSPQLVPVHYPHLMFDMSQGTESKIRGQSDDFLLQSSLVDDGQSINPLLFTTKQKSQSKNRPESQLLAEVHYTDQNSSKLRPKNQPITNQIEASDSIKSQDSSKREEQGIQYQSQTQERSNLQTDNLSLKSGPQNVKKVQTTQKNQRNLQKNQILQGQDKTAGAGQEKSVGKEKSVGESVGEKGDIRKNIISKKVESNQKIEHTSVGTQIRSDQTRKGQEAIQHEKGDQNSLTERKTNKIRRQEESSLGKRPKRDQFNKNQSLKNYNNNLTVGEKDFNKRYFQLNHTDLSMNQVSKQTPNQPTAKLQFHKNESQHQKVQMGSYSPSLNYPNSTRRGEKISLTENSSVSQPRIKTSQLQEHISPSTGSFHQPKVRQSSTHMGNNWQGNQGRTKTADSKKQIAFSAQRRGADVGSSLQSQVYRSGEKPVEGGISEVSKCDTLRTNTFGGNMQAPPSMENVQPGGQHQFLYQNTPSIQSVHDHNHHQYHHRGHVSSSLHQQRSDSPFDPKSGHYPMPHPQSGPYPAEIHSQQQNAIIVHPSSFGGQYYAPPNLPQLGGPYQSPQNYMIPPHHYGPNMPPPTPQSGSFLAPPTHQQHPQIPYSFYPENTPPALSHQYAYAPPHYFQMHEQQNRGNGQTSQERADEENSCSCEDCCCSSQEDQSERNIEPKNPQNSKSGPQTKNINGQREEKYTKNSNIIGDGHPEFQGSDPRNSYFYPPHPQIPAHHAAPYYLMPQPHQMFLHQGLYGHPYWAYQPGPQDLYLQQAQQTHLQNPDIIQMKQYKQGAREVGAKQSRREQMMSRGDRIKDEQPKFKRPKNAGVERQKLINHKQQLSVEDLNSSRSRQTKYDYKLHRQINKQFDFNDEEYRSLQREEIGDRNVESVIRGPYLQHSPAALTHPEILTMKKVTNDQQTEKNSLKRQDFQQKQGAHQKQDSVNKGVIAQALRNTKIVNKTEQNSPDPKLIPNKFIIQNQKQTKDINLHQNPPQYSSDHLVKNKFIPMTNNSIQQDSLLIRKSAALPSKSREEEESKSNSQSDQMREGGKKERHSGFKPVQRDQRNKNKNDLSENSQFSKEQTNHNLASKDVSNIRDLLAVRAANTQNKSYSDDVSKEQTSSNETQHKGLDMKNQRTVGTGSSDPDSSKMTPGTVNSKIESSQADNNVFSGQQQQIMLSNNPSMNMMAKKVAMKFNVKQRDDASDNSDQNQKQQNAN